MFRKKKLIEKVTICKNLINEHSRQVQKCNIARRNVCIGRTKLRDFDNRD